MAAAISATCSSVVISAGEYWSVPRPAARPETPCARSFFTIAIASAGSCNCTPATAPTPPRTSLTFG